MENRRTKRRHITGVDGLRAIAVIGVIIYHLMPSVIQGGFLGVPIFLLISGYFVTCQLVVEYDQTNRINFFHFYHKRFKKLYPTLIAMLVATTAYITLFQKTLLTNIRSTIWTNLLWVYNWWEIGHGQSYFDRFAGESPFTHLWTLGVEVQFYVLWPMILVILMMMFYQRRHLARWVVLLLAVLSAIEMAVLYNPTSLNRVYYGTDTRAFSLMLGAFLGLIWPIGHLRPNIDRAWSSALDFLGILTLLVTIFGFFTLSGQDAATYRGAMFGYSFLGMILLATVVHPGAHINRILTNRLFTWLGKRSYGIYVYQFPVMIFYEKVVQVGNHPLIHGIIQIVIIMGISELSYRYFEQPLANYDWRNLGRSIRALFDRQQLRRWLVVGPAIILLGIAIYGLCIPAPKAQPTAVQKRITQNAKTTAKRNQAIAAGKTPQVNVDSNSVKQKYGLTAAQVKQLQKLKITAVGDSVMVDASQSIQQLMPLAYVDGQVGRQGNDTPTVLKTLASQGRLADIVVLNLGTNGPISDHAMNEMLSIIGSKRQVYWVTAHVPTRSWQDSVNDQIKKVAKNHKNVHLVDWYQLSKDHGDWFASDQVHMQQNGNVQFTRLIATTILKYNK